MASPTIPGSTSNDWFHNLTVTNNTATGSPPFNHFELPLSLMASFVVVGNSLVCTLYCHYRKLRTITNTFVVSLAVSDVLVAIVFVPCFLMMSYVPEIGLIVPYVIGYILFAYMFNFCGVTYDRYQAIVHPLSYHAKMTRRTVNKILILVWTIPMVITLVPAFWYSQPLNIKKLANQINQGLLVFSITAISVIICMAYCKMFRETRHQIQKMAELRLESLSRQSSLGAGKHRRKRQLNISVEVKAAKVFAVLITTFAICWFPLIFINIIEAIGYVQKVPQALKDISLFTLVGNSFLDPLIYSLYKTDFRNAVRKFCCCWKPPNQQYSTNGVESSHITRVDSSLELTPPQEQCCSGRRIEEQNV